MIQPAKDDNEFQSRMQQLEGLLREIDAISDPIARAKTGNIIEGLMAFHGAAIAGVMEHLTKAGEAGRAILAEMARDELIGSMLLLYGLHPEEMEARVRSALEKVRPHVEGHGGKVELLGIERESVRVSLKTSGKGCPSTGAKLKTAVEQAIYSLAPEVTAIEVEGDAKTAGSTGFVPVELVIQSAARHHPIAEGAAL